MSLGVAVVLMAYLKSNVHGGSTQWMNPRWWRIFAKVEFVRVVSNIIVQGRLQLDLVLDCVCTG